MQPFPKKVFFLFASAWIFLPCSASTSGSSIEVPCATTNSFSQYSQKPSTRHHHHHHHHHRNLLQQSPSAQPNDVLNSTVESGAIAVLVGLGTPPQQLWMLPSFVADRIYVATEPGFFSSHQLQAQFFVPSSSSTFIVNSNPIYVLLDTAKRAFFGCFQSFMQAWKEFATFPSVTDHLVLGSVQGNVSFAQVPSPSFFVGNPCGYDGILPIFQATSAIGAFTTRSVTIALGEDGRGKVILSSSTSMSPSPQFPLVGSFQTRLLASESTTSGYMTFAVNQLVLSNSIGDTNLLWSGVAIRCTIATETTVTTMPMWLIGQLVGALQNSVSISNVTEFLTNPSVTLPATQALAQFPTIRLQVPQIGGSGGYFFINLLPSMYLLSAEQGRVRFGIEGDDKPGDNVILLGANFLLGVTTTVDKEQNQFVFSTNTSKVTALASTRDPSAGNSDDEHGAAAAIVRMCAANAGAISGSTTAPRMPLFPLGGAAALIAAMVASGSGEDYFGISLPAIFPMCSSGQTCIQLLNSFLTVTKDTFSGHGGNYSIAQIYNNDTLWEQFPAAAPLPAGIAWKTPVLSFYSTWLGVIESAEGRCPGANGSYSLNAPLFDYAGDEGITVTGLCAICQNGYYPSPLTTTSTLVGYQSFGKSSQNAFLFETQNLHKGEYIVLVRGVRYYSQNLPGSNSAFNTISTISFSGSSLPSAASHVSASLLHVQQEQNCQEYFDQCVFESPTNNPVLVAVAANPNNDFAGSWLTQSPSCTRDSGGMNWFAFYGGVNCSQGYVPMVTVADILQNPLFSTAQEGTLALEFGLGDFLIVDEVIFVDVSKGLPDFVNASIDVGVPTSQGFSEHNNNHYFGATFYTCSQQKSANSFMASGGTSDGATRKTEEGVLKMIIIALSVALVCCVIGFGLFVFKLNKRLAACTASATLELEAVVS